MTALGAEPRPYVLGAPGKWRVTVWHGAWLCLLAAIALSLLGLYAIDLGVVEGARRQADPGKQLLFVGVGLLAGAIVALPHYRLLGFVAWPVMVLSLASLVFLLLPGVPAWLVTPRNGARGWINLGVVDFQPAEPAKIAFVLAAAHYLRYRSTHRRFIGLVPVGLIAFVPMALIILQPDLGTASLFVPALLAMLLAAGARLRHLALIVTLAALAGPAAYPILKPHQKQRIAALIGQFEGRREGALDINYQSFTAQTLVGAGQWTGSTPGHARALVRFNRLPERHNDMIFAVIVARFGLLGAAAVLALYAVWLAGALLTAANCKDPFGRLLCVGFAGFVGAQAVVNIGMNVGLLPIIGVTLPFVSYGGSSTMTTMLMTGLIFNVAMRRPLPPFRPSFEWDED
ncbi:MAG: FtsW/RodA/SpoVE family cell cycle protein [Phycisphaerae bacterium]|nr:FtsW/RodA/SpoVE family cell cycle protein [Phycisphaerae bacterium]